MKTKTITLPEGIKASALPFCRCIACDTYNCATYKKITSTFPDAAVSGHAAIPARETTVIRCLDCGEEQNLDDVLELAKGKEG